MASGIYQFWKYWLRDRKFIETKLRSENLAEPELLTLSSNVSFVYVIFIIVLVLVSNVVFRRMCIFRIKKYSIRQMLGSVCTNLIICVKGVKSFTCTNCNLQLFRKTTRVTDLRQNNYSRTRIGKLFKNSVFD